MLADRAGLGGNHGAPIPWAYICCSHRFMGSF